MQEALTFKQDNMIQSHTVFVEIPAFTWFQYAISQNDHFDWFQVSDKEDNLKGKSKWFH